MVHVTDMPADDLVDGFAARINPYMERILGGSEDPHRVVGLLMGVLTEPPYFEHLWGVGWLYRIWGDLSDIVDRWPVDMLESQLGSQLPGLRTCVTDRSQEVRDTRPGLPADPTMGACQTSINGWTGRPSGGSCSARRW